MLTFIAHIHILAIKTFIRFSPFIIYNPSVLNPHTTHIKHGTHRKKYEKYKRDEKEKDFKSKQRKIDTATAKASEPCFKFQHVEHRCFRVSTISMFKRICFASDIQKYYEH